MYLQRDIEAFSRNHFCTGDTTIHFISIVGADVVIRHIKVYCFHGNATVGSSALFSSHKIFHLLTTINTKHSTTVRLCFCLS